MGLTPSRREIGQAAGLASEIIGHKDVDSIKPETGENVPAMIYGEDNVKTFSKKNGHYWLLLANDK